jgi:hypothetical protein
MCVVSWELQLERGPSAGSVEIPCGQAEDLFRATIVRAVTRLGGWGFLHGEDGHVISMVHYPKGGARALAGATGDE